MRNYAWITITFLLTTVPGFGQYVEYRQVRGKVMFRDGEPVRGATVQLRNTRTLDIRSYVTKADGTYHFDSLSADVDYQIRAEYRGISSATKTVSRFDSRKVAVINLKLDTGKMHRSTDYPLPYKPAPVKLTAWGCPVKLELIEREPV